MERLHGAQQLQPRRRREDASHVRARLLGEKAKDTPATTATAAATAAISAAADGGRGWGSVGFE